MFASTTKTEEGGRRKEEVFRNYYAKNRVTLEYKLYNEWTACLRWRVFLLEECVGKNCMARSHDWM
jgi:hypothetical protein